MARCVGNETGDDAIDYWCSNDLKQDEYGFDETGHPQNYFPNGSSNMNVINNKQMHHVHQNIHNNNVYNNGQNGMYTLYVQNQRISMNSTTPMPALRVPKQGIKQMRMINSNNYNHNHNPVATLNLTLNHQNNGGMNNIHHRHVTQNRHFRNGHKMNGNVNVNRLNRSNGLNGLNGLNRMNRLNGMNKMNVVHRMNTVTNQITGINGISNGIGNTNGNGNGIGIRMAAGVPSNTNTIKVLSPTTSPVTPIRMRRSTSEDDGSPAGTVTSGMSGISGITSSSGITSVSGATVTTTTQSIATISTINENICLDFTQYLKQQPSLTQMFNDAKKNVKFYYRGGMI